MLFFILPVLGLLVIGLWLSIYASKRLHTVSAQAPETLPQESLWTLGSELSMALVLGNASFFFAYHCLRGFGIMILAAIIITAITAIGSHYRYKQILQPLTLDDDKKKQLLSVHGILAAGLFFTIGPQLALILTFLRHAGRL